MRGACGGHHGCRQAILHCQVTHTDTRDGKAGGQKQKSIYPKWQESFSFFFPFSRKKAKAEALQLVQGENQGQQGSNSDHSWEKD